MHCKAGCSQAEVIDALRERRLWATRLSGGDHGLKPAHLEHLGGPWELTREWAYSLAGSTEPAAIHGREECQCSDCDDAPKRRKRYRWRLPEGTYRSGLQSQVKIAELGFFNAAALDQRPDEPVWLVEGEAAVEACEAQRLLVVSLPGGAGQRDFGHALEPLRGRKVLLWPDADDAGRSLMRRVSGELPEARRLEVQDLPEGGDAVEFFDGWTDGERRHPGRAVEELEALAAQAKAVEQLPRITANNRQLREVTAEACDALVSANDPPRLFTRGGDIIRSRRDERGRTLLERFDVAALRHHMTLSADYVRRRQDGRETEVAPPLGDRPHPGPLRDDHRAAESDVGADGEQHQARRRHAAALLLDPFGC